MFRLNSVFSLALIGVFLASIIAVLTLERPPVDVVSPPAGPGIGMQTFYNPASVNRALGINRAPTMLPAIDAGPAGRHGV